MVCGQAVALAGVQHPQVLGLPVLHGLVLRLERAQFGAGGDLAAAGAEPRRRLVRVVQRAEAPEHGHRPVDLVLGELGPSLGALDEVGLEDAAEFRARRMLEVTRRDPAEVVDLAGQPGDGGVLLGVARLRLLGEAPVLVLLLGELAEPELDVLRVASLGFLCTEVVQAQGAHHLVARRAEGERLQRPAAEALGEHGHVEGIRVGHERMSLVTNRP